MSVIIRQFYYLTRHEVCSMDWQLVFSPKDFSKHEVVD